MSPPQARIRHTCHDEHRFRALTMPGSRWVGVVGVLVRHSGRAAKDTKSGTQPHSLCDHISAYLTVPACADSPIRRYRWLEVPNRRDGRFRSRRVAHAA